MARRLRVLIADDHPIVTERLRQLLPEAPDVADIGEAADPQQVLDRARARE
jgi:DNA-binding NarL/FixJ family response regulator